MTKTVQNFSIFLWIIIFISYISGKQLEDELRGKAVPCLHHLTVCTRVF